MLMKITIIQQDIVWGNPAANCMTAARLMATAPASDIYVLPEMFSTGFGHRPQSIGNGKDETLDWMSAQAREKDAAICGSVAVADGGQYFNRFYFVEPDGKVTAYDKRHLFTFGGEDKVFSPGSDRPILSFRGFRILPEICYDLRFPVWARNGDEGTDDNYHIIIYVASWPRVRQQAWDTLLRARAIENQCYVVGVNRVGRDPHNDYAGGSAIIGPQGETLAECEERVMEAATAEVSMASLTAVRRAFPVLRDRDAFTMLASASAVENTLKNDETSNNRT
jgi:omega-amidase